MCAQQSACGGRIGIAWVLLPCHADTTCACLDVRARQAKHRSHNAHATAAGSWPAPWNRPESAQAGAATQVHQQRLKPVISVMRERNVIGTRFARGIEQCGMPELSCIVGQAPAAALGVHVTPHVCDAKLSGERCHMGRVGIRIGAKVVVNMHRYDTSARGSPARDGRACRQKDA